MSSDNGHGAAGGHHDDHHDAFDPEPVQELGADETPSPTWLPVVGGALLLVGAMWAFYPGAGAPAAPVEAAPAPSAAAPAARASAATPRKASSPRVAPSGNGSLPNKRMIDLKNTKRPPAKPTAAPKP